MKRKISRYLSVLAASLLIAACGGGGGGGGGGGTTTTSSVVSGSVTATSASGAAAKAALITDNSVAINIISYDKANTKLGEASVTSDSAGGFNAQLTLSSGGGYVVVTATKDGYTQFQKRVDYTTPGKIELQAALQQVNVAFANIGSALASGIGKSAEPSFNFALVTFPDGTKKALAGSAIKAAKAVGGVTETSITIPATSLPNVSRLKGELQAYDPATQSDRFPGSYFGTYTGSKKGTEGRMISLAFDYVKISDADSGKSLGKVAKDLVKAGVSKAAANTTTVTRHIYSNSCGNLFLQDYNTTKAGHQVPVWSLQPSTGKWVFIGEGTIVDSNSAVIAAPTETICGNGNYYLEILVANTDFASSWWNLDHIVFDTPKEVCLNGTIKYSDNTAVNNQGINLSGSIIDNKWGYTATDGSYSLSTVLLNKSETSRAATLAYYDENGNYTSTAVTLGDAPNCGSKNITLTRPCDVSGKLTGDGAAYRYIRLTGNNFYRSFSTDSAGNYASKVKCGTDIDLFVGSLSTKSATFNVNGTVETGETSDNASAVVLADIAVPNIPPTGYLWFSNTAVKLTTTYSAYLSGYDEDSNYPVTWTLNIKNGTTVAYTTTGSFTASSTSATVDMTGKLTTAGDYTSELVLTDSKGASRTVSGSVINVSSGNRPPVAYAYASNSIVNSCGGSSNITLYGSGYGIDSTTLTSAWTSGGNPVSGCSGTTVTASSINDSCLITAPATAGRYTYTFTLSDNNGKSATQNILISTFASSPWISTLTASPSLVAAGSSGTARDVSLSATASNSDNASMTGNWKVNGTDIAACPNAAVASGSSSKCTYTVPSTAVAGDVFTFTFTATTACGTSASRDVRATYGTASDVTVVVQ
jgi:hypothetical protein